MRISIGVIIAIVLIFVWYRQDHPTAAPVKAGFEQHVLMRDFG